MYNIFSTTWTSARCPHYTGQVLLCCWLSRSLQVKVHLGFPQSLLCKIFCSHIWLSCELFRSHKLIGLNWGLDGRFPKENTGSGAFYSVSGTPSSESEWCEINALITVLVRRIKLVEVPSFTWAMELGPWILCGIFFSRINLITLMFWPNPSQDNYTIVCLSKIPHSFK